MPARLLTPGFYRNRFSQAWFTISAIARIFWQVSPFYVIAIFVVNILWGSSILPALYLEKLILDAIVSNLGNPAWQEALVGISLLLIGRATLEIARTTLDRISRFLRFAASRMFSAQVDVLISQKISEIDVATIEDPDFQNKFNKIERESGRHAWGLMVPFSDIPNYLAGFISSVGLLFFLHPLIVVGIILFSFPQMWADAKYIKEEYKLYDKVSPLFRIWGYLNYILMRSKAYLELRVFKLAPHLVDRLRGIHKEIFSQQIALAKQKERAHILTYLPSALFYFGVNIYIVALAILRTITVGGAQMYLRALLSVQNNLSGLVTSLLEIYENYLYVTDLQWLLNLKPKLEAKKGEKLPRYLKEGIEFKSVWFKYKREESWVLRDINISFKPGEVVAIVGENGVGKSTLIKMLARFYDPQKGKVLVEGKDLKKIDLAEHRGKLAILFQRFETYPFTARESIGYGDVARVEALPQIQDAARKTGIHTYIEGLKLRYENPLSPDFEKGVEPSFGQWQRIALSRILFRKKAEIVVLDEPTSNVDSKAEEEIFNKLMKKARGKLLVFVSQRFSTVRRADKIFVMDKGRIIEQGTHDQLMRLKGKYAELFNLQAKGYV